MRRHSALKVELTFDFIGPAINPFPTRFLLFTFCYAR